GDPRVAGGQLLRELQRFGGGAGVALVEERLAAKHVRVDRRAVELERDSHLGEHLVEALEGEERLTEHDPSVDGGRASEQAQATDLDGLLKLAGRDQGLPAADKVALRHLRLECYAITRPRALDQASGLGLRASGGKTSGPPRLSGRRPAGGNHVR